MTNTTREQISKLFLRRSLQCQPFVTAKRKALPSILQDRRFLKCFYLNNKLQFFRLLISPKEKKNERQVISDNRNHLVLQMFHKTICGSKNGMKNTKENMSDITFEDVPLFEHPVIYSPKHILLLTEYRIMGCFYSYTRV